MFFFKKIDITKPRRKFEREFDGPPEPCPECGSQLKNEKQGYVVGALKGSKLSNTLVIGNKMGWFCVRCPSIVINRRELELTLNASDWEGGEHTEVLGLVDWKAAKGIRAGFPPFIPFQREPVRTVDPSAGKKEDQRRQRDKRARRNQRKHERQNKKKNRGNRNG